MKTLAQVASVCTMVFFALGANAEGTRIQHMADTYLQSALSQMIDTGYCPNPTTKVVLEYEFSGSVTGTRNLFDTSYSDFAFGMYIQNETQRFCYGVDNSAGGVTKKYPNSGLACKTMQRFIATMDNKEGKISITSGGVQLWSTTMEKPRTTSSKGTLRVFAHVDNKNYLAYRLYSLAIYDDGKIVRDFIPYNRGEEIGLLDKCSGKVYTDVKKVNKFTIGTEDGYVKSTRNNASCLDSAYTVTPQTKLEVDFSLTDAGTANQCIFSTGSDSVPLAFYVNSAKHFAWTCQDDAATWHDTGIVADGARRTFTIDIPNAQVSLARGTSTPADYTATIDTPLSKNAASTLKFFLEATSQTPAITGENPAGVKLYGLKVWEGATLVRSYSPQLVDSVPGMYETQQEKFIKSCSYYGLGFGGDIECASGNADAYIELNASQSLATDYSPTQNTRLAIDYLTTERTGTKQILNAGDTKFYLYYQRSNNTFKQALRYPNDSGSSYSASLPLEECRYNVEIDLSKKSNTVKIAYGDKTQSISLDKLSDSFALDPLRIASNASGDGARANLRLYSLAIYEGSSETPVRFYTPCVIDGTPGLWDSCKKTFTQDLRKANTPLFGGAGLNGGGMVFTENPQGCRLAYGRTATLSAYAPGAVGYQWLKNGEIIEGATHNTLEVSYGNSGKPDIYQCISHYAIRGYGLSAEAKVENLPRGFVVLIN